MKTSFMHKLDKAFDYFVLLLYFLVMSFKLAKLVNNHLLPWGELQAILRRKPREQLRPCVFNGPGSQDSNNGKRHRRGHRGGRKHHKRY